MSTFFNRGTLIIVLILFCISQTFAQRRFKAGIIAGVNVSQLDGDDYTGFHKIGAHVGARGVVIVSPRFEISTEILFSQKGSRFEDSNSISKDRVQKIGLNYMVIPILFNYLGNYSKERDLFRHQFSIGVSIGRLIGTDIKENEKDMVNYTEAVDLFNKSDISVLAGFTYFANQHIGLGLRLSVSANLAYDGIDNPIPENELRLLRSYLISFRTIYMF